jgi:hypothetical protein
LSESGHEAPVRTEPLPTTLSDALCLGAIVLVLDFICSMDRGDRLEANSTLGQESRWLKPVIGSPRGARAGR